MKSYIQIEVPSISMAANRGASPGPAIVEAFKYSRGRVPGPVGSDARKPAENRLLQETIAGGAITIELNNKSNEWRIKPPAYAHWNYYLPATHGKWARNADEITIRDFVNRNIYFSLKQANKMHGRAFYELSTAGRYDRATEWKRVPKPLPTSGEPPVWYGLAIEHKGEPSRGTRQAAAFVISANKWFTFSMPAPTAGSFRGYGWNAAFVVLTGYIDRGDLIAHPGTAVDHELSLGGQWAERAESLNKVARFKFEELMQFALQNSEMLRTLGTAAVQETCIDYDERRVMICDLFGAGIKAGIHTYTGECVVLDLSAERQADDESEINKPAIFKPEPPSLDNLMM
ncbi:MAG TPA: hypothetical protein VLR90_20060 [Blastocatellia bacterium]|nr:hypothetical protein [Blastocatellia bacterium]